MDIELLTSILIIIGIDVVLGGDNAIVIALACRNLPERQRNKAIILGAILAIILRIICTILAVYLLEIPFLQFAGGCFLILIAYKLLTDHNEDNNKIRAGASLSTAVKTIVIADLVMGLDNVIAVAGAAHGRIHLVVLGLIVSIPIIIWGSKLILFLMERYPIFIYGGAAILAYTAGQMIIHEQSLTHLYSQHTGIVGILPIIIIVFVLVSGYLSNKIKISYSIK
ncbi:TerC family protein [Litchfieldia salsa]|uniref:Integral membrane protein, YjbE family n=1 Tax=Litchfieldia salsa TaxID=930152 RepID=A0A1H0S4W5_9BACI|nr:TerC family protein [Litchfieldia salsa]SDP36770.1 integral membrane protein, YjbE family [Litchfieldia salsa]